MQEVEKIINYSFKNKELIKEAFIHSSFANEKNINSYENLEFLGDSVLSLIISVEIMKHYNLKEGDMTKLRARIVSSKNLAKIIEKLNLDKFIQFGKSMKNQHNLVSVNGDVFESITGAMYLDGGFEVSKKFVLSNINVEDYLNVKNDFKTMLQEIVQGEGKTITYNTNQIENSVEFLAEVIIDGEVVAKASSTSKKEAETNAAEIALKNLQK